MKKAWIGNIELLKATHNTYVTLDCRIEVQVCLEPILNQGMLLTLLSSSNLHNEFHIFTAMPDAASKPGMAV